ncbi:hypothetical protein MHYP_G00143900 [Metynnis hypsauchen]
MDIVAMVSVPLQCYSPTQTHRQRLVSPRETAEEGPHIGGDVPSTSLINIMYQVLQMDVKGPFSPYL